MPENKRRKELKTKEDNTEELEIIHVYSKKVYKKAHELATNYIRSIVQELELEHNYMPMTLETLQSVKLVCHRREQYLCCYYPSKTVKVLYTWDVYESIKEVNPEDKGITIDLEEGELKAFRYLLMSAEKHSSAMSITKDKHKHDIIKLIRSLRTSIEGL